MTFNALAMMVCRPRSVSPHDGVPDRLFRQEANFTETTNLPQVHKTALNKLLYADMLRSYDEHSPARPRLL